MPIWYRFLLVKSTRTHPHVKVAFLCILMFFCVFLDVFSISETLRPADMGPGYQPSPFLILRADAAVTSTLNVIHFTYLLNN